jgi:hypothetical protein
MVSLDPSTLPAYDGGHVSRAAHSRFLARLVRTRRKTGLLLEPRPTAVGLERHAARFGPEQVAETAAEYGIAVAVERPVAARKVKGPTLRQRVADYVAGGHSADVIAELEDISPNRARQLVQEVTQ